MSIKPIDTDEPFEAQVAWSRQLFDTINEHGGTWGVPRSGLIFNRHGNTLVLVMRLPHDPDMPVTPEQLKEYQQNDYDTIRRRFEAAGIEVRDVSMT